MKAVFPDKPKVKLENYLPLLDEKIRLAGINKIPLEKAGGTSLEKIAEKSNMHPETVRKYLNVKKACPLFFLKKIAELDLSGTLWNKIFESDFYCTARKEKVILPKYLDPALAYFVGYLQGDGFLCSDGKRTCFDDEYKPQIELVCSLTEKIFGTKAKIEEKRSKKSTKQSYRVPVRRKVINSFINKVFGINLGKKSNLRIPKIMKKNRKILKWYLRGLFDADGTLPKSPHKCAQFFVDVSFKDKGFIEEIKENLQEFGIETLKPYGRKSHSPSTGKKTLTWELRIRKHSTIKRFLEEIGFIHPNKSKRQEELLKILRTRSLEDKAAAS